MDSLLTLESLLKKDQGEKKDQWLMTLNIKGLRSGRLTLVN